MVNKKVFVSFQIFNYSLKLRQHSFNHAASTSSKNHLSTIIVNIFLAGTFKYKSSS